MTDHTRPILCIIPGWGGTQETWKKFATLAAGDFDVHCIELPCFGGVACPQSVWGVEQYAEYVNLQLKEIRKQSDNKKIILLGHSFGGQVAVSVASTHPDACDELVLIAAAAIRPRRVIKRAVFSACVKIAKALLRNSINNTKISDIKKKIYNALFSPDYMETSGIEREIFKKVIREDMRHVLSKIVQHTLVFWGRHDSYTPLRHGKMIARLLPEAELVIFRDGRHGLHHTHSADILSKLKARYTTE